MNENFVTECIEKYSPEKAKMEIAFDIGANYGIYTEKLAKKFAHVYAFEAHPENIKVLMDKVKDYENVTVVEGAISDMNKDIKLYTNPGNPGGHSISSKIAKSKKFGHDEDNFITVSGITIDDFCRIQNVVPSFIKMDIEGAENFVWNGAVMTLNNHNPRIIMEVHKTVDCAGLWRFFKDQGYKAWGENRQPATKFKHDYHFLLYKDTG